MTRLFVLICCFALVWAAGGETESKKGTSHTKSSQHVAAHVQHTQTPHHPATTGGHPQSGGAGTRPTGLKSHPETAGNAAAKPAASAPPAPVYHYNFRTKSGVIGRDFTRPLTPEEQSAIARQVEKGQPEGTQSAHDGYDPQNGAYHYTFRTKSGVIGRDFARPLTLEEQSAIARQVENGQAERTHVSPGAGPTKAKVSPLRPQQFKLPSKPDPAIAGVTFEGTGQIPGSEHWIDPKYGTFRDYRHEWHDKDWWDHHCDQTHHNRPSVPIILVYGGWYLWHAGYWYPAWGYDPHNSYYPYDGPIYAYGGLAPDQVVANVQAALQALGYYHGPVNGLLDSATRSALADYQRDHGLYTTSAIDESTLAELGMSEA